MEIIRPRSGENSVSKNPVSKLGPVPQPPSLDLEDLYCILQIDPNDSFIALELAQRLRRRGNFQESWRILRQVVKIDYRFETVHALGQVEYELDKIDEAFEHLQQALLIAPEHSLEFFDLFKTLGNIFCRRSDWDSAEDSYHRAHRTNPDSDVLLVNFGTLSIQRFQWEEALRWFREALSLNKTNDKAWVGLALCHRTKGDWELGWGNIETALHYNPFNELALNLALDWATQERQDQRALSMLRKFLVSGGWSERASLAFAWLSWRRGDGRIARLELERLLAVNPANAQALSLLSEIGTERD